MIMLGIDPGLRFTGYSIAHRDAARRTSLVDYGFLRLSPQKSLGERIGIFHAFFTKKITEHKVTTISLETPFLGKNAQNFLKLGYLRGIVYLLCDTHTISLQEYSPREVKQAVTGYGGASKDQVERIILQLFPRMKLPEKQDVTDALAVCLCGLWRSPQVKRKLYK